MEAALQAGARRVFLLEEPVAAALGAGLSISEPKGKMVIDIGAGATDIAVLSLSGVVESASIRLAGDRFNEALIRYVRRKHNILIGDRTAEELKLQLGCVYPGQESRSLEVKGRCLLTGLPKLFPIHTEEMLEAFDESCEGILDAIRDVLERTPPELVSDISETGITLTGGGSQLWGMDKLIESRTRIPTQLADDGHECVISGLERALNWLDDMQDGAVHFSRRKQMS